MSADQLTHALEELVADLPEVDLSEPAWREAERRRSRRRSRAAAAAAAVAIGAGAVWITAGRGHDRVMVQVPGHSGATTGPVRIPTIPPSSPSTPPRQPGGWVDPRGWRVDAAGVRRIGLLEGTRYRELPMFGGPLGALAGPVTDLSQVSLDTALAPATAVSLEGDRTNDTSSVYRPVVLTGDTLIRLDDVPLHTLGPWLPGDSRAISADGSALVFPQPSRVVVVDLLTRAVHQIVVPDQALRTAGWSTRDPGVVIASSDERSWRVDLRAMTVRRAGLQDVDSVFELQGAGGAGSALTLSRTDGTSTKEVALGSGLGSPLFRSVSANGRVAIATRVNVNENSIVVADTTHLRPDGRPTVSVLTIPDGLGFPIGWDPAGRYLHFATGAGGGSYILVWDVQTGGVYRAARMSPAEGTPVPIALGTGYGRQ
jgi:hypothetical protein